ncbi:MAG: transporter substrate-binding domain-containing protein [Bdellovibrionales bacterium]
MKLSHVIIVALLSVAATLTTVHFSDNRGELDSAVKESAYDRVKRTSTLRCGYLIYPTFVERDLKTNAFSGMWVDVMEEIGRQLSLKIEWTEEVGTSNAFDGLKTNRYDIVVIPFNQTPGRARETEFTEPIMFMPYYAYVRADDTRFDNAYEKINDPSVRYAYLEGELSQYLKADKFPNAQSVSLPSLTDMAQVFLSVAMGKADITSVEPSTIQPFLENNPGKLKRVPGPSLMMLASGFDVAVGEDALRNMLNTTIRAMHRTGVIEKIVNKHTTAPEQFFLPIEPWGKASQPNK